MAETFQQPVNRISKLIISALLIFCFSPLFAKDDPVFKNINTFESADRLGIIVYGSEPLKYKIMSSQSPPEVVITFQDVDFGMGGAFVKYIHLPPVYRVEARVSLGHQKEVEVRLFMDRLVEIKGDRNGTNLIFSWVPTQIERKKRVETRRVNQFDITVSINFKDAELIDVLRLIAKQNSLNIIAGEDVVGTVTANLKDVSLGDALDALLKVNGYDWFLKENIVVVKPQDKELQGELETRVYKLEYVDAGAVATALTNVLSKKGKVQIFSKVLAGGASGAGGASSTGGAAGGAAGGGAAAGLAGALGGGGVGGATGGAQGGATGGAGTGSGVSTDILLISDLHNNFPVIEDIIKKLDQPIPQINIAVKFIETNLDMNERLGINWNMRASLVGGDQGSGFPIGKWKSLSLATLDVLSFSAILDVLSSDNQTRLIQEPQITTADNTLATVSVGTNYPVAVPSSTGGLVGTQPVTFENQDIQIKLNVKPHINEKVFITMNINAVVQALVGFTGPNADRPIISERTTTTQVKVGNGETLLIGGLIFEQEAHNESRVPLLGRIPLLGRLFRNTADDTKQRELLIFITPNIVSDYSK